METALVARSSDQHKVFSWIVRGLFAPYGTGITCWYWISGLALLEVCISNGGNHMMGITEVVG